MFGAGIPSALHSSTVSPPSRTLTSMDVEVKLGPSWSTVSCPDAATESCDD